MTAFKVMFGMTPDSVEEQMNVWHGRHNITIENWKIAAQDSRMGGGLWVVIEYTDLDLKEEMEEEEEKQKQDVDDGIKLDWGTNSRS